MLLNAVIAVLALAAIPLAILLAYWFVKNRCQSGNKGCRVCRLKCEKKDDNDDNDNNSGGLAALSF